MCLTTRSPFVAIGELCERKNYSGHNTETSPKFEKRRQEAPGATAWELFIEWVKAMVSRFSSFSFQKDGRLVVDQVQLPRA